MKKKTNIVIYLDGGELITSSCKEKKEKVIKDIVDTHSGYMIIDCGDTTRIIPKSKIKSVSVYAIKEK